MTDMDSTRHSALQLALLVAFSIVVSGLSKFFILFITSIQFSIKTKSHICYIKYWSKVDVLFLYADMCIEVVVGRINAEIVSSLKETNVHPNSPNPLPQSADCPKKCKTDSVCSKCCDSFKPPLYGVPVCRDNTHCVCSIHSPGLNNIHSQTLTIAT